MNVSNNIKRILKAFLPPIVVQIIQSRRNRAAVYPSYTAALADADGYQDMALVKAIAAKGKIFRDTIIETKQLDLASLRTVIALAVSLRSKTLRVIDFGGAAGTHFFMAKAILGNSVKLDWRIVETPGMVQAVTEEGLNNSELSFFDSLDKAAGGQKFDLIFCSCSLNYTPDPYSVLDELVKIQAKYLMVTRTPIADRGVVLLQHSMIRHNGAGNLPKDMLTIDKRISYPVTILERSKVERSLKEFGEILLRLEEEKQAYESKDNQYDFWGYVVKR